MKKNLFLSIIFLLSLFSSCTYESKVVVLTTNDLHGALFTQKYVSGENPSSLSKVCRYVDSIRDVYGAESLLLLDAGDHLQGDNGVWYYNYRDTSSCHIVAQIFNFMGYDAVVAGNHDFETGHSVYDRFSSELDAPYLAANAIRTDNGKCYFDEYVIITKNGVKMAVIGFTNPNVISWISADKYEGIRFRKISSMADSIVSQVRKTENPDICIVALHSGLGDMQSDDIENCGKYIASNVKGIDAVVCGHDHKSFCGLFFNAGDSVALVDARTKALSVGRIDITVKKRLGKVVDKSISCEVCDLEGHGDSKRYNDFFKERFDAIREFSGKPVCRLLSDLDMNFSKEKSSDHLRLVHLVQLSQPDVDISVNAPLSLKGTIHAGEILFNDLFSIYKYENLLYLVRMSGEEIRNYLEAAYDIRISGKGPVYNMDDAAGINYTVNAGAGYGSRVKIISMADGTPFSLEKVYNVALTSYRASGAGGLLSKAGIDPSEIPARTVRIDREIRDLIYLWLLEKGEIDPCLISKDRSLGNWRYIK